MAIASPPPPVSATSPHAIDAMNVGVRYSLRFTKKTTLRNSLGQMLQRDSAEPFWALRNVSFGLVRGESQRATTYDAALGTDGTHLAYVSAVRGEGARVPAVFLRELATGKTQLISADVGGGRNDRPARRPSVNDDGSVVAFDSASADLVAGDTNGVRDVFVRTLPTGPGASTR